MAELTIVWRNPNRVRHHLRWLRPRPTGNLYIIQQLISNEHDIWTDTCVLELIRGQQPRGLTKTKPRAWRFNWLVGSDEPNSAFK